MIPEVRLCIVVLLTPQINYFVVLKFVLLTFSYLFTYQNFLYLHGEILNVEIFAVSIHVPIKAVQLSCYSKN